MSALFRRIHQLLWDPVELEKTKMEEPLQAQSIREKPKDDEQPPEPLMDETEKMQEPSRMLLLPAPPKDEISKEELLASSLPKGKEPKMKGPPPAPRKGSKPKMKPPPPKYERKHCPFLVIGYTGHSKSRDSNPPPPKSGRIRHDPLTDATLNVTQDAACFKAPWSDKPMRAYRRAEEVSLQLPPFSNIIGFSTGTHCFPNGSVEVLPLQEEMVLGYGRVFGVIIPKKYPTGGRIICCLTDFVEDGIDDSVPQDHRLSCGLSIVDDCTVVKYSKGVKWFSKKLIGTKTFQFCSTDYAVREIDSFITLHNPMFVPKLLAVQKNELITGFRVRIPYMPVIVFSVSIALMAIPGVIQFYGSQDNMWGDILNQVIGTGSVLVGVVFIILERMFGNRGFTRENLLGNFIVKSDMPAKIFARSKMRELEKLVCDPRIPPYTVGLHRNSPVRAPRKIDGLRLGSYIKADDMPSHGYVLIPNLGLVLDTIEAKYYRCYKNGATLRLRRLGTETGEEVCNYFEGTESFE